MFEEGLKEPTFLWLPENLLSLKKNFMKETPNRDFSNSLIIV